MEPLPSGVLKMGAPPLAGAPPGAAFPAAAAAEDMLYAFATVRELAA
jgi:hypothetical protein